ncbi:MAG: helix-turn-helix domain-containing protein [Sarcina sp.]
MSKIDLKKLGIYVQEKRKEKNYSQDKLGELTGINRQIIGRIEIGKTLPSLPQLQKLLDILEINFDEILISKKKNDVFMAMRGEAKTNAEKEGLEKMIDMMLCLKKQKKLRKAYK